MTDSQRAPAAGPLKNLRVVELGVAVAGPMAATLMADLGADVIKVEEPDVGDSLRNMGPKAQGVGLWWLVAGRNKRCITLNLKAEAGVAIMRDLLRDCTFPEAARPGRTPNGRVSGSWRRLTRAPRISQVIRSESQCIPATRWET